MDDSRHLHARTSLKAAFGFLQVEFANLWNFETRGKRERKKGRSRVEGFERQSGRIERPLKINLRSQAEERGSVRKYNVYNKYNRHTRLPTILQKSQNPKAQREEAKLFKWANFACVLRFRCPGVSRIPFEKPRILAKLSVEVNSSDYVGIFSAYNFSLAVPEHVW